MRHENTYLKTAGRDGIPLLGVGLTLEEDGDWHPTIEGDLKVNENGYHACRDMHDVLTWIGPELWLIETRGHSRLANGDAIVLRHQRPVTRLMNEEDWRAFSILRARAEFAEITSRHIDENLRSRLLGMIVTAQDYSQLDVSRHAVRRAHNEAVSILQEFKAHFSHAHKKMPEDLEVLVMAVIHCLSPEPWCVMGWILTKLNSPDPVVQAAIQRHTDTLDRIVLDKVTRRERTKVKHHEEV